MIRKAAVLLLVAVTTTCAPLFADVPRETEVRAYIDRGRRFFDQKDFHSAIKTWSKVLDIDPLNQEALDLIDEARFQSDYQVAVLDKLKKEERLKTPYASELSKMAGEMADLLEKAKSKSRFADPEPSLTAEEKERLAAVRETYRAGLAAYDADDVPGAFREWEKIVPVLPEEYELRQKLAALKEAADAAAAPSADEKLRSSEETATRLVEVNDRLRAAAEKVSAGRSEAERGAAERRQAVDREMKDAEVLYAEGKYEEAFAAWERLAPRFEDGDRITRLLDMARSNLKTLREAESAGTPPPASLAPPRLLETLEAARRELETRAVRPPAAPEPAAGTQGVLAEAERLFKAGKTSEAVEAWRAVAASYSDASGAERILAEIERLSGEIEKLRTAAVAPAPVQVPAELLGTLSDARKELEARVAKASTVPAPVVSPESLAAFGEGRRLFDEGKTAEALAAWRRASAAYTDAARAESLLGEIGRLSEEIERARKAASAISGQVPAELIETLERANRDLMETLRELEGVKKPGGIAKAEVTSYFQYGMVLFDQGRYAKAIENWRQIIPLVSDGARLEKLIEQFEANTGRLRKANRH